MTRTLAQIKKQIEKLEKEADAVRAKEVAGVVQRIKAAIDFYGLTAANLFGAKGRKPRAKTNAEAPAVKAAKPKRTPAPAKYKDKESGKTWNGIGKRPRWFVQAMDAGGKPEDLAL